MSHLMTLTIVFVAILVAMSTCDATIAAFVQKAKAMYENCNGNSGVINNNSTTCVNLFHQHYQGVTLAYLLEDNTDRKSNHNETASSRNMNIYPYDNMPFLLPFP